MPREWSYAVGEEILEDMQGSAQLSQHFRDFGKELVVLESKSLEDVCRTSRAQVRHLLIFSWLRTSTRLFCRAEYKQTAQPMVTSSVRSLTHSSTLIL